MLEVKSRILTRKRSSLLLQQSIWKQEQEIFSMKIKLVYIAQGKISRIPEHFIELLENMI